MIETTRRGVLAGMAGGVTIATLPSTSPAAMATKTVDPLVALEAELLRADADVGAVSIAVDRAEGERWLGLPHYVPSPAVMAGNYHCLSEATIHDHCQPNAPDGPSETERDRLIAELRQRQVSYLDARERAGLAGLDKELTKADARWDALLKRIATTPATTLQGVAVKVRRLEEGTESGATVYEPDLARTAIEALERLGEGRM